MGSDVQICRIHLLRIFSSVLFTFCVLINLHDAVRLGGHSTPSKGVTVLPGTYPNPVVFYNHFVAKGEPLLMKDVLPDSGHKAFKQWTDEYLRLNFGDEFVHVERGKKENRKQDVRGIRFAKFLDIYHDADLYMVYSVPPVMQEDVQVPFTLQCGGFQQNLHDSVIWFSGGGTKSVLHYDAADNILCSLDGMKQVVLIDKKYADRVMAHDFVELGSYSLLDVDDVDKKKFADILSLPWVQANITKGDCLYIPYKWFHHLYSVPGRNLAINTWFSHLWWLNKTDCEGVARGTPFKSLSEIELASPNEQLRTEFLEAFANMDVVKHDEFIDELRCEEEGDGEKIWNFINKNGDDTLTWPEMYKFSMDNLVSEFPQCFLRPADMEDIELEEDREGDDAEEGGTIEDSKDVAADKTDETKDTPVDDEGGEKTEGIYDTGVEVDEEQLEEINTIFQKVYKENVGIENQILVDNIEEGIMNYDYETEEYNPVNDKVSEENVENGAKATEPRSEKKAEKTATKDVHDEF